MNYPQVAWTREARATAESSVSEVLVAQHFGHSSRSCECWPEYVNNKYCMCRTVVKLHNVLVNLEYETGGCQSGNGMFASIAVG